MCELHQERIRINQIFIETSEILREAQVSSFDQIVNTYIDALFAHYGDPSLIASIEAKAHVFAKIYLATVSRREAMRGFRSLPKSA